MLKNSKIQFENPELKKIVFYTSGIKWLQFFNMMIQNNIGGNNDKANSK